MKHLFTSATLLILFSSALMAQSVPYATLIELPNGAEYDSTEITWFQYNANNYNTIDLTEEFDNGQWKNSRKAEYTYDANNDLTLSLRFRWQLGFDRWDSTGRLTYAYYKPNLPVMLHQENYNSNSWSTLYIDSTFYNSNDDRSLVKGYWKFGVQPLELMSMTEYYYDSNDELKMTKYMWRDTIANQWDTLSRSFFSKDNPDKQDTVFSEDYDANLGWVPSGRFISKFDANNHIVFSEFQTHDGTDYVGQSRAEFSYHSDGRRDMVVNYFWNSVEEAYEEYSRSTDLYGTPIGLTEHPNVELPSIYPNPANDVLNIKVSSPWLGAMMIIHDVNGRILRQSVINNQNTEISVGSFEKGSYIIRYQRGTEVSTDRFIVE